MKIVIDIPEESYNIIKSDLYNTFPAEMKEWGLEAIRNGTPLPKGHGDLIDKDRLLDELEKTVESVDDTNKYLLFWDRAVAHVHLSKPIIEADKPESGDKLDGDPIDIDKAVEHYEGTLEALKGIDLEVERDGVE